MKKLSVKTFVAIGIGAALFFVLGKFAAIPVFGNTTITLQYVVLAFFAVLYGPVAGALIGLVGHTLIDITSWGPWWSWIVASGIMGLLIGFVGSKINIEEGEFGKREAIWFIVMSFFANFVTWGLVAPVLDILIYQEPANKVFTQGLIAGVGNYLGIAILGTILLFAYAKTRTKKGSLDQE